MRKLYAKLLLLFFLLPFIGSSQVLSWNLSAAKGNETTIANSGTGNDLHLYTSLLSRGAGVVVGGNTLAGGFTGSGWNVSSQALSESGNLYYQFTVSSIDGYLTSLTNIDAWLRNTSTGPMDYQWEYSLDGFTSTRNNIGSSVHISGATATGGAHQALVILSDIPDLQNIPSGTTVTFRIYAWNASATGGTFAVGRPATPSLMINGAVAANPANTGTLAVTPTSLTGFTSSAGVPSASQSIAITGSQLTNDITVTAPTGFEVSTDNSSFTPAVTVAKAGDGSVNATVYTRINSSALVGTLSDKLVITSGGAAGQVTQVSGTVTASTGPAANIVINQVYGGGGNSGAPYNSDFIELYNNETTPVNLNGWSVQYASASGTSWQVTPLSGTIPAKGFFLVQEATSTNGIALPTPDVTGTIPMAAGSGKVLITNTTTASTGSFPQGASVTDFVGYGTADASEVAAAPVLSNTTADVRKTEGVDNNNNSTDFQTASPLPRNSTYKTAAPVVTTFTPPAGRLDVPSSLVPSLIFNKQVFKKTGTVTIVANGVAGAPIDINDASIVLTNTTLTINTTLTSNTTYAIQLSAGAIADAYNNNFAGLGATDWTFKTYDAATSATLPYSNDFETCSGSGLLPNGFTQYSVLGAQIWDCAAFGRNPSDSSLNQGSAVQVNGYFNGIDNLNEDWLISPKFDLTGTSFPLLSFWSRNAFAGSPLQLKISTDYTGTGDPNAAHWTDLNGKFPSVGSDYWAASTNINLSAFKQDGIYLAFVYTSTTDDGSRWTIDDIQLVNSATPPPPTLTLSTGNVEFGYAPANTIVPRELTEIGNDLTSDITITSLGSNFQISGDSITFGATATIGHDTANNKTERIYLRFIPDVNNLQFQNTVQVTFNNGVHDTTYVINVKGNSIAPASTLSVIDWNLNWFATGETGFGPTNKEQQKANVRTIMTNLHPDLFVLEEVVNDTAMANIAHDLGYGFIINNYGSHANTFDPVFYPINTSQKLAFLYNPAKFSNLRTDSLLNTAQVNTAADVNTTSYNNWAGGRYPYMLTADVTLDDNNGGTNVKTIHFIDVHAKANTGDVVAAYNSRRDAATALETYVRTTFTQATDNVIILGDFNDDLNKTITTGAGTTTTSYSAFTIQHPSNYIFPTMILSQQGQHSDVNYTGSIIDNVVINSGMSSWYLPSSATVLSDVSGLVKSYGSTTTDHYPVFTQFSFTPPVTLPVTLLSFAAVRQDAAAHLTWTTTQENNSASFEIQRSGDNSSFTAIGTVAAKGNSTTTVNYSFNDPSPLTGNNYYRLKQIDIDGKSTYSKIVLLNFSSLALRISPNPAHGTIHLYVSNNSEAFSIRIVDLNGQTVKQFLTTPGTADIPMDVSSLAKGIYTVKAISPSAMTTQKLLIQ